MHVGKFKFGKVIDITDPCYNKGSGHKLRVKAKAGTYNCYVSLDDSGCVASIQIEHESCSDVGHYKAIGSIGVDSYLAGFFNNKPDYSDDAWNSLLDSIYPNGALEKSRDWAMGNDGFYSKTGFGNGVYTVYGRMEGDRCVGLEIIFIDDGNNV